MKQLLSTREIVNIGLITALMIISAWITVPFVIPFTLQTMAVAFAILRFRNYKAIFPIIVYIGLGLVGIPVFSGFKGGPAVIAGPTGGFIIGFIFMGIVGSFLIPHAASMFQKMVFLFISILFCYMSGLVWYVLVYIKESSLPVWKTAFSLCVLPFIIPDIINLLLAIFLDSKLRKFTI